MHDRLADDERRVLPGQATIQGRAAVIAAREAAACEFAQLAETDTVRFVSVADDDAAAVDATIRYRTPDGSASVVSSADISEFDGSLHGCGCTCFVLSSGATSGGRSAR